MAPTSQRVLVVGATGMLGSLVAKEAAAKGHRVTALVSERSQGDPGKKSAIEELTAASVELAKGSLESPQSVLVELAKKADVVRSRAYRVCNCACARVADTVWSLTVFERPQIICVVTREATEAQVNLVHAAAAAGNVKQFFPSEFGILGAVGPPWAARHACAAYLKERVPHDAAKRCAHCPHTIVAATAPARQKGWGQSGRLGTQLSAVQSDVYPLLGSSAALTHAAGTFRAGDDACPEMFQPKLAVRKAIQDAKLPYTYVVSYGAPPRLPALAQAGAAGPVPGARMRAAAAGPASQRSCCASPGVPGPRACQALGLAAAPGKRAGLGWAPAPSKPGLAQLRACCCTPSRDWMPRTCSTMQTPGLGDACCWGPARRATGRGLSAQNTRCLLACAPLCAGAAGDPVRGRQGLRGTGPTAWARSASWTRCRP